MPEQYIGTCPICGVTLIVIPGNKLQCPDAHYICDRWAFEIRWRKYQQSFRHDKPASFDRLLIDLVNLNELDIDPLLIVELQEKATALPESITNDNEP